VEAAQNRLDAPRYPLIAARLTLAHIQVITGSARSVEAKRALPLFERVYDRRFLSYMHAFIALEYSLQGAFDEAQESAARAVSIAQEERMQHSVQYVYVIEARCCVRARASRLDEARADLAELARLRAALGDDDAVNGLYWGAYIEFADGNVSACAELLEECVHSCGMTSRNPANALCDLGAARIALGEIEASKSAALEALELSRFEPHVARCAIWQLAAVAALRGYPHSGARLIGFAKAESERQERYADHFRQASYETIQASLHGQLSNNTLAALFAQGALLDFDRAVDEALNS
jgi:hypothetical protein